MDGIEARHARSFIECAIEDIQQELTRTNPDWYKIERKGGDIENWANFSALCAKLGIK